MMRRRALVVCRLTALGFAALHAACTVAKGDQDSQPAALSARSCEPELLCEAGSQASNSCCESIWLWGGPFQMGFSPKEVPHPESLAEADADHQVQLSGFFLDRFEVSRARFAAYAANYAGPPAAGSGAHPWLEGSGWQPEWDGELPDNPSILLTAPAENDLAAAAAAPNTPMGSLSWFVAFAFCIWDGGRLPTEAEWEFAAAAGAANFAYPWGDTAQPIAKPEPLSLRVGGNPLLRGRFGHDDLAGGVEEWVFDWYSERYYVEGGARCYDCANLVRGVGRGVRGARDKTCCTGLDTEFRSAARYLRAPGVQFKTQGVRCARDAPETRRAASLQAVRAQGKVG